MQRARHRAGRGLLLRSPAVEVEQAEQKERFEQKEHFELLKAQAERAERFDLASEQVEQVEHFELAGSSHVEMMATRSSAVWCKAVIKAAPPAESPRVRMASLIG